MNDGSFISFCQRKFEPHPPKIQENENQVREILQEILKNKGEMLADQVMASRNGRNVLPVKIPTATAISGVVPTIFRQRQYRLYRA